MQRKKLVRLLKTLEEEIKLSRKRYEENKEMSDKTSKTARGSWSASGDREYARGQAMITKKVLDQMVKLRKEISKVIEDTIPEIVQIPCYVATENKDEKDRFYLVENIVNLRGISLVSAGSPLGKKLIGKKVNTSVKVNSENTFKIVDLG